MVHVDCAVAIENADNSIGTDSRDFSNINEVVLFVPQVQAQLAHVVPLVPLSFEESGTLRTPVSMEERWV
jgi:hypothetical protein